MTYPIPIYFGWIRKIKQFSTTPWENGWAIILVPIHKMTAADPVTLQHYGSVLTSAYIHVITYLFNISI